jgi:gliding motility-associated-like protein
MRIWCFVLLFGSLNDVSGQNLIPNGGFENTRKPLKSRFPGNIEQAEPWFPAGVGSPDLISGSAHNYGNKAPAHGKNYCGIILYDADNPEFREYLQVKLTQTLEAGKAYCLRFKAAPATESWIFTDDLGFYFSSDTLQVNDWNVAPVNPQLRTKKYQLFDDSTRWTDYEIGFTAQGNERFLSLGNFRNDASTMKKPAQKQAFLRVSYLLLDEFYLGPCTEEALPQTSTEPVVNNVQFTETQGKLIFPTLLTPNGDGFNDVFTILNLKRYSTLKIFDRSGKSVYSSANYSNDFDGSGLPEGKYDYELRQPDGNITYGSFELSRKKKK